MELVSPAIIAYHHHLTKMAQGELANNDAKSLPPKTFGYTRAPACIWASCIRIVDPVEVSSIYKD